MPTVSPAPSPETNLLPNSLSKPPVRFTPPLIGMLVIIATAFIIITYSRSISRRFLLLRCRWRHWRRRRRLLRSFVPSDVESGEESYDPTYGYQTLSRYGLNDDVIKTIPLSVHTRKRSVIHECAVCLLQFEDNDYVRTLPVCFHSFHVDCIDIWLRCHANCPLCRSSVFRPQSPFIPLMSARIRPNFDDVIVHNTIPEPSLSPEPEITPYIDTIDDVSFNRRDLVLKRSYSFGFERNLSFWCKMQSPVNLTKTRVFSFRSSFFRRRSGSFVWLSESSGRYGGGGSDGSSSSRRRKSLNSGVFSSNRLRSGDPEALLSPERYNRLCR